MKTGHSHIGIGSWEYERSFKVATTRNFKWSYYVKCGTDAVIAYLLLFWTGGCHLKWFVDEQSSEVHETTVATASSIGAISTLAQWANGKRRNNFWVIRVVVQAIVRVRVMDERHQGHPRIVWMKALARNYVRWHKFEEVEKRAKSAPVKAPLHP